MAENTAYTVSDFIKEYSSAATDAARSKICQNHMTRTYVPVLEKYVALSMGFNNSSRNDMGVLHFNSFMNYVMYTIISLSLYYDFINTGEGCNYMDMYDSLAESGIRDVLLANIGKSELSELGMINDFIASDVRENESSPQNFIGKQMSILAKAISEKISPEMINELVAVFKSDK